MTLINRLSLRSKFLIAPGIGLALMLLLSVGMLLTFKHQSEHITHLEKQEQVIAELMEIFSELSGNHALIYNLMVDQTSHTDEALIYTQGKPYIYKIYELEKKLNALPLDLDQSEEKRVLHEQLQQQLIQYRAHVVSALEMATVDVQLATRNMSRATSHYIGLEIQFVVYLTKVRESVKESFTILDSETRTGLQASAGVIFVAIACMILAAIYLSRRLSLDIYAMISAMKQLAAGDRETKVPVLETSSEVAAMAHALDVFKTGLQQLDASEERLRLAASVFENTDEGVVITDPEGYVLEVNRAFTDILGYSREEVIGRKPSLWKSQRHDESFYRDMWFAITEIGQWRGELWNRRKDGTVFPEWQTISGVVDDNGEVTHYVAVFSDISQIKHSQEKLDHLAHHDALTGLPNRLLLNERLEQAIRRAERHSKQLAVVFLDLDRFKHINDSLGHPVGDLLLHEVAANLVDTVRKDDTVARISGDEFVLVLEDIDRSETVSGAAGKLVASFADPFRIADREIRITASLGISLYPGDGEDSATLLRNADAAMYRAKEEGRNTYHFYTEELTRNAFERVLLENNLRKAIENNELQLYYQPQINLTSRQATGVEALVRWMHPELGMISPARFIPLAEESGLIHPLGQWVLRTACEQGKAWMEQGINVGRIAVNVSGAEIQRGKLVKHVESVLEDTGFPASNLELEVTESFIMQHVDTAVEQLEQLRKLGVTLAVDDFGTGYSSLSYLKQLPIHKLKIDQSFVRDIPNDPDDMAIADAVIAMSKSLQLMVIAEGVETEAQASFLRSAGCGEAQGYLFSKPVSADTLEEVLSRLVA